MEIWVIEGGMNYEGSTILGVSSTEQRADRLRDEIERKSTYDWVSTTRHVVDRDEPEVRFASFT